MKNWNYNNEKLERLLDVTYNAADSWNDEIGRIFDDGIDREKDEEEIIEDMRVVIISTIEDFYRDVVEEAKATREEIYEYASIEAMCKFEDWKAEIEE